MSKRSPYAGSTRKLVLAFDVGTTYSGISYSILDPGQVPEIRGVTRFPAQEQVGGDSKIPTIIYYDEVGSVQAAGAEAMREGVEDMAEDEGWVKSEWFKLHLRPKSQMRSQSTGKIPPLPANKHVVDVFADFLRYLYACARTYIQDTHAGGIELWRSVECNIDFVLTHPNGWEGSQQNQMRRAAVHAGLIPDTVDGQSRITFVTEGEASLHFCIQSGLSTEAMKNGDGVLIVDGGGGTIDISAYGQGLTTDTFSFEEIASSECHFQGSVFVTQHAQTFLEDLLRGSRFFDDVPHITKCFDKTTKLGFRNRNEPQYIKFGSARDRDPKLGIRSGQLKLTGHDVASFFEPSVNCIVQAILGQRALARKEITVRFAASDWLFSRVKESLEPLGIKFCRPDSHINKAVADGAISFYVDHFVRVRVSKHVYGTECATSYDGTNLEHIYRESSSYNDLEGGKKIPGVFDVILSKNTQVSETKEFRRSYYRLSLTGDFSGSTDTVECYRGQIAKPGWKDADKDMFSTLCYIQNDLSHLAKPINIRKGNRRQIACYRIDYDIILLFGVTELQAQLCWQENGVEKRTPAKIVYDPDVVDGDFN